MKLSWKVLVLLVILALLIVIFRDQIFEFLYDKPTGMPEGFFDKSMR